MIWDKNEPFSGDFRMIARQTFNRSEKEIDAIKTVCSLGAVWGYGNLIHALKIDWADMLMRKYKLDAVSAAHGAWMEGDELRQYVADHADSL